MCRRPSRGLTQTDCPFTGPTYLAHAYVIPGTASCTVCSLCISPHTVHASWQSLSLLESAPLCVWLLMLESTWHIWMRKGLIIIFEQESKQTCVLMFLLYLSRVCHKHFLSLAAFPFSIMSLCDVCVRVLSLQPPSYMVTCRSSGPFPGSYITTTRKPVIVLFAKTGFSNVAERVEFEIIQYTVCLTNQLYAIQATTGPIPCPGPLSARPPPPPPVLVASPATVLTGISVIFGW